MGTEHANPDPALTAEADHARREAERTVNGMSDRLRVPADLARAGRDRAKAAQERMVSLRSAGRHLLVKDAEASDKPADKERKAPWRVAVAVVAAVLFVRRLIKRRAAAH